ncbi:MAG TPA: AbrB/MazE/SpoVT family DNA-binding domain-containing protein [Acidobacteriaceae bacterium]
MATATVTSKGQITIPVDVRTELDLKAGDQLDFQQNANGRYELIPRKGSVRRLKGILKGLRPPMTVEEMNKAIAGRASEKDRRSKS